MSVRVEPFEATATAIEGLWVLGPKTVSDERGAIRELFRQTAFIDAGLPDLPSWRQVNLTETNQGAIRGLHGEMMTKLVGIVSGAAFGAYVDTRRSSPTRGELVTVHLQRGVQVLVPDGVCNGFQSLSPEPTQYLYCFDQEWAPGMAGPAVNPLDPQLAIPWPLAVDPLDRTRLSEKDAGLPSLGEVLAASER